MVRIPPFHINEWGGGSCSIHGSCTYSFNLFYSAQTFVPFFFWTPRRDLAAKPRLKNQPILYTRDQTSPFSNSSNDGVIRLSNFDFSKLHLWAARNCHVESIGNLVSISQFLGTARPHQEQTPFHQCFPFAAPFSSCPEHTRIVEIQIKAFYSIALDIGAIWGLSFWILFEFWIPQFALRWHHRPASLLWAPYSSKLNFGETVPKSANVLGVSWKSKYLLRSVSADSESKIPSVQVRSSTIRCSIWW